MRNYLLYPPVNDVLRRPWEDTMSGPKTVQLGDPCPACGGELRAAAVPTDEEYRKAFDKENPVALAPGMDTASPEVRVELGDLHRCVSCGYQTRFRPENDLEGDAAAGDTRRRSAARG